ncbi:MAG: hypothetical protein HYT88_01770, partial [Candidatus Omnitrophica bacterium]|nr:hypothetical protein [Candidatus Omnitrophota bacterium]
IYAATNRGVIVSSDGGQSWRYLEQSGLASTQIKRLAFSPENPPLLYAATSLGVARYDAKQKRWQLLTSGLTGRVVNDLALSTTAILAATAEGLYRYPLNPAQTEEEASSLNEVKEHFAHEPSVLQVQQAAIRYAEVHPEKIAAWRQQARWQALLPDLTLSTDTNLTDFRHWDSGTSPDSLLRGERDIDWSASLTWDFGDFVWSTDQTSIDSRSKLMVELRDDIVDTVTRTYFERRRLQAVQLTHPLADSAKQLEQALRIEELTALIDGLTGGYFSTDVGD